MTPPRRFVDAHVHLWDLTNGWYPLLENPDLMPEAYAPIGDVSVFARKDFGVPDYDALAGEIEVAKIVHVTAAQMPPSWVDETRWLQSVNERCGRPNAAIGYTSFDQPLDAVDRELAAHAESDIFRGVRHAEGVDFESDHVLECFGLLQEHGLIYDICTHEDSLLAAAKVAGQFDGMTFVLEHLGWPSSTDSQTFAAWREGVAALAALPNTAVKLSGFGLAQHEWDVTALRPWVEAAIEAFGTDRAMFASNFPIDRIYSTYAELLGAFEDIAGSFSPTEQDQLFVTSAERWYRI